MKNTVKQEREKRNIMQKDLAWDIGISRETLHEIESKKTNPSVVISLKLAKYFGLGVEELFYLENK